ncbi:Zinc finger protein 554 [Colletotrichum orbiculare MAFF 240422]|uniref:Zinc finger protein 554 n=1 Tax=Colletotrichum orbiculare (strain 104-T / ATCC 96160 / CBS 514.97 / LARS 414 / MAFF 240422) TaxID=1213857 RepID=A0A484G9N0_COLOR|nr:Zinc finger protein 554 [Colletotrichum orbiculare MAFF 240422]
MSCQGLRWYAGKLAPPSPDLRDRIFTPEAIKVLTSPRQRKPRFCDTSASKNTTLSHSRSASIAGHPVPFMDFNQQAMAWNPNLIDDGTLPWVQTSAPQYLPFSNYDYMQDNGNNTPDLVHSSATNNFVKGAESGSERCCSVMGSPCDKPNCEDGWDDCDGRLPTQNVADLLDSIDDDLQRMAWDLRTTPHPTEIGAHYLSADNDHSQQPAQPFSQDDSQTHVPDNALESSSSPVEVPQEHVAETVNHTCRWLDDCKHECGRTFDNDKDLQTHCRDDHIAEMVKRTKEERSGNKEEKAGFWCLWAGCSRVGHFTQKSKLERHLQTHTGYKPVRCSVCNLALSAKQSLQQHMRIHTGEKPWKCTHEGCPQSFKQQSALTMHARTHTGAKPLSCSYCGKTFGESSNLSKHKKTHNEKGEHRCSICGKDFHRLDQLRRHNKIHEKRSGSGTAVASSPVEDLNRMTQKKPSGVRKGKKK